MTTATRASLEELKDFANKVREAGGGNPLHALMPATPTDASKCLIAKNLNFNCMVAADDGVWYMSVGDEETARSIAEALDLDLAYIKPPHWDVEALPWRIYLPNEIGLVANDFDKAWYVVDAVDINYARWEKSPELREDYPDFREYFEDTLFPEIGIDYGYDVWFSNLDEALELIQEMWPYVEESFKETAEIGIFNEKGELLL